MTGATAATIRPMVRADLAAAVALLGEAGLGGASGNLARYLRWQPASGWIALRDDTLVGTVTLLRWGHVGFVGCMAVAPAQQGRGLGRRLLEHAHTEGARRGATTFLLEATPSGERLYAKLGYITSGESTIAMRAASGGGEAAQVDVAQRDALFALDRAAIGMDRRDMLAGLLDEGCRGVVVPGAGYGLVVGERLGPLIARDASTARALVDQLVAPCTVITAPARAPLLPLLTAHGFTEVRRLKRMHLGASPIAQSDQVWALASPGAG